MDIYDLLMAQMGQAQQSRYGFVASPPQNNALGNYGTQLLQQLGLGPEAIQGLDPQSWSQKLGNFVGLDQAGIADLNQNLGVLSPQVERALAAAPEVAQGINDQLAAVPGQLDAALAPMAGPTMEASRNANTWLSGLPLSQEFMNSSPFQPLPEGQGFLDAINTLNRGTPYELNLGGGSSTPPLPLPPTLEAMVREANQGKPTAASNDPLTHTFDMGTLPPAELFRLSLGGGGGGNVMGQYADLAQQLPQAERVSRQMAPPTDFTAADAAMEAARPQYEEGSAIGQVLQGMARAGMAGMRGDTGDFLLALGLGGLGGLGSGMDLERERRDLATEREREYQLRNAGYQSDKAGVRRSETQQGFDAEYESDVNYNAAKAMRQQQVMDILTSGLDQQNIDRRENTNNAIQIALHNQQQALERWKLSQPTVETNQYGVVTTATDANGRRTMTIDNSPWVQKLQTQAMFRQMGALGALPGANMPGMDFGDNAEVDGPELVKRLSTYYFMNPMAMQEDLGPEFMTQASMATKNMAGDNEKLVPQMMGNNIYSFLAPIVNDQNHPLHRAVLMRMAQMQGMF